MKRIGLIESNISKSKLEIIVKTMIMAMEARIGARELSDITENTKDNAAIVHMLKIPNANDIKNREVSTSTGNIFTEPIKTRRSPFPNMIKPIPRLINARNKTSNVAYVNPQINFAVISKCLLSGLVIRILNVPAPDSPETRSPVTITIRIGT